MRKATTLPLFVSGAGLTLLAPALFSLATVSAQPSGLMVDPGGTSPAATSPAPVTNPAAGGQLGAPAPAPTEGAAPNSGLQYYGDYLEGGEFDNNGVVFRGGVVPYTHTVRTGDTLWDLSAYYFNDAWKWPQVWGLNPEVTNPHWIYPGNILRLKDGQARVASAKASPRARRTPVRSAPQIGLRQVAYVDLKELEDAGRIAGSVDDKGLLSDGDMVYIQYPSKDVPKIGERFAVYRTRKSIKRKGKSVGAYVEVTGQVEVVKLAKDKRALAVVVRSVRPIERSMRVGPLELNFADMKPVVNKVKVDGHIVGLIGPDELIGAEAAILVDRGRKDGVEVGNRFLVIRRGDAYQSQMQVGNNVGLDDERYPARAIGEITIIQTGESASMGIVSFSTHEFGVGDRVYMRKGK